MNIDANAKSRFHRRFFAPLFVQVVRANKYEIHSQFYVHVQLCKRTTSSANECVNYVMHWTSIRNLLLCFIIWLNMSHSFSASHHYPCTVYLFETPAASSITHRERESTIRGDWHLWLNYKLLRRQQIRSESLRWFSFNDIFFRCSSNFAVWGGYLSSLIIQHLTNFQMDSRVSPPKLEVVNILSRVSHDHLSV